MKTYTAKEVANIIGVRLAQVTNILADIKHNIIPYEYEVRNYRLTGKYTDEHIKIIREKIKRLYDHNKNRTVKRIAKAIREAR